MTAEIELDGSSHLGLLCVVCGHEFWLADGDRVEACPNCGDNGGTPGILNAAFDVRITHEELRLYTTWAEQYVAAIQKQHPGPDGEATGRAFATIRDRIFRQVPPLGFTATTIPDEAEPVMTQTALEALARGEQVLTTTANLVVESRPVEG